MVKVSREQSERLRRRVLDAAVIELAGVGYASLAITAVALRAGVATSAVYHRFATKDHLVGAVVTERLEPTAGHGADDISDWLWGQPQAAPRRRSAADAGYLDAWCQVLAAAAFPSGPRHGALALLERRLEHGCARRAAAPAGTVRPDPDPTTQTLLPLSVDLGAWLLMRGLGRSPRWEPARMTVIRSAVRIEPASPVVTTTARRLPRISPPPTRHRHDHLGATLLGAAGDAVAHDGFAATTVAGIARRAGSSTGAVYNRFTGKGGLLAECLLATNATGADDRSAALLVESLRLAPVDPEVADAVTTAVGHALAAEAHSLAVAHRDSSSPMVLKPSSAARLRVSFSIGHWVVGRILSEPDDAWRTAGASMLANLAAGPPLIPGDGHGHGER